MLMSRRIIPTIGECLGTVMMPLCVSFSFQIKRQVLVKFDKFDLCVIVGPFDFNQFMLDLGLCQSFKGCALLP